MQAQRKTEQVQVELGSPCVEKGFGQPRFFSKQVQYALLTKGGHPIGQVLAWTLARTPHIHAVSQEFA